MYRGIVWKWCWCEPVFFSFWNKANLNKAIEIETWEVKEKAVINLTSAMFLLIPVFCYLLVSISVFWWQLLWHKCLMDHEVSEEGSWPAKSPQLGCFRERRPAQHNPVLCQTQTFTLKQQYYIPRIPILILLSGHIKHHTSLLSLGASEKKQECNPVSQCFLA